LAIPRATPVRLSFAAATTRVLTAGSAGAMVPATVIVAVVIAMIITVAATALTVLAATSLRAPGAAFVIIAVVVVVFAPGLMASASGSALTATGVVTAVAVLRGCGVDRE